MSNRSTNNYLDTIAAAIAPGDTSITVTSGTGLPTLNPGDYITLTLDDLAGTVEIVYCTAIVGTTLTVTRGQEGTTAVNWPILSGISHRLTAASIEDTLNFQFDFIDDDTMAAASAITASSSESIKTYVDNEVAAAAGLQNVVEDLTPEFAADLDMNNNEIYACLRVRTGVVSWDQDTTNNITFSNSRMTFKPFNADVMNITTSGIQLGAANARVNAIYDTDTLGEDSAVALATQQSIKAYVDGEIAGLQDSISRVWALFDSSAALTVLDSLNVASVSDDGVGLFTITFTSPFATANYAVAGIAQTNALNQAVIVNIETGTVPTASAIGIQVNRDNGNSVDSSRISIVCTGE